MEGGFAGIVGVTMRVRAGRADGLGLTVNDEEKEIPGGEDGQTFEPANFTGQFGEQAEERYDKQENSAEKDDEPGGARHLVQVHSGHDSREGHGEGN